MTKTLEKFTDPEMPTIIPEMGTESPKTDVETTYPKEKNIDEAIHQKLRNKDVYETDMHKIYNIIVGKKNEHFRRRRHLMPPYMCSSQAETPLGNWWS